MFQLHFVPGLLPPGRGARRMRRSARCCPSDTPGALLDGHAAARSGVVGAIAPWNAALILSARAIAAPLALGNTVVLKPSEYSPVRRRPALGRDLRRGRAAGGRAERRHARAAGRPAPIGERARRAPGACGHQLHRLDRDRAAARRGGGHGNLKRILLELGGHNPLIVLGDADLEYAVNASAFGAFLHQGQICMSARRIIVERSIADEFTRRLAEKTAGLKAGDPREPDTIIGPLITEQALEHGPEPRRRRGREGREGARRRRGGGPASTRRRC